MPLPPPPRPIRRSGLVPAIILLLAAAGCRVDAGEPVLTISGSSVGAEGDVLRRQVARFERLHGVRVEIQPTPDDATQRHQLFVQWLNARLGDPDVLQLDVVWSAEFAAAGWLHPLDPFGPDTAAFLPAAVAAGRWRGRLFALPWFVDVGLVYRRTDLVPEAPATLAALHRAAAAPPGGPRPSWGMVWQGARYEGLVTVFLEYLTAFGGRILDERGRVVVDQPPAVRALGFMRSAIERGIVPRDALTWHEEETRFAFQNGRAVFMRNWPYAFSLLADTAASAVAGRVAVMPLPPAGPSGRPASALGGAALAVNARSDRPSLAWRLVAFLTAPEQMLERARLTGQFPPRTMLYRDPRLAAAIPLPLPQVRRALEHAVPRPATPVYSELSEILQIHLHRALAGQVEPAPALAAAARQMNALLERTGLAGS